MGSSARGVPFRATSTRRRSSDEVSMKAHWIAFACLPVFALSVRAASVPTGKPEDVGLSSERLQRVTATIRDHIAAGDVAGVVTLVARRGRIAHFDAQGSMNIELKRPMTRDAIFRLASMSKPVTGVAVMLLVEEGRLRLRDPVSRFLPEFGNAKVAVPRQGGRGGASQGQPAYDVISSPREITIFDLLTHTSGLVSGGPGAAAAPQRLPTDTLASYIPRLGAVPLDFDPGTL